MTPAAVLGALVRLLARVERPRQASVEKGASSISALLPLLVILAWVSPAAAAPTRWVTHPAAVVADARHTPIALQFRREFALVKPPAKFVVRVSADNRYLLFVNGRRIAAGPSRGDLAHWRYEAIDLAPYLHAGGNVVAAEVWNDGPYAPVAQISARTGFLVAAEDPDQAWVGTGPLWRVRVDASRTVSAATPQIKAQLDPGSDYYAAAPPERHLAASRLETWRAPISAAADWAPAVDAAPDAAPPWTLVPDRLPQMRYQQRPGGKLVRSSGVSASGFPDAPVVIPAHTQASLLIDAGKVQAAYPRLIVSGGEGAKVTVTYAEALYDPSRRRLFDRAQTAGGAALGLTDTFEPAGQAHESFEPFWWRTWRFAEIKVTTAAAPLRFDRFERFATGYPFATRARFDSDDPELNRIWRIGWDTVRLDAHETFMDTAYWEQLQYVGDTRLEALVANAVSGDPRLPIEAIAAFDTPRVDGLPPSRWPSNLDQSIPPFALLWIGMVHDYWMWRPDPALVRRMLPTARGVLDWYGRYLGADGLVGATPGWEFIDWRPGLSNFPDPRLPPHSDPCIVSLLYIGALQQAADLEQAVGDRARGHDDLARATRVTAAVRARCWSAERELYADTPAKQSFSQHTNLLAVLYGVAPEAQRAAIMNRITLRNAGIDAPAGVIGVTYYFAFYLAAALERAGLADRYPELLSSWRKLLAQNFTTWPEQPDPSRSDSHAWSAHPTAGLLTIVAGIEPAAPGFASVRVAPHLGKLQRLDAAMPHPNGIISVRYRRKGRTLRAVVDLPVGTAGSFDWRGRSWPLKPGRNTIMAAPVDTR